MEGSVTDLSKYRFEAAEDDLETAKMLFDAGRWKASLNRSYYAVFHALRSVTALDSFDAKKHSAIIAYFNQHYIKSGIFAGNVSKMIADAFELRGNADYQDFYVVSKGDAQSQIDNAEMIINTIRSYLETRRGDSGNQSDESFHAAAETGVPAGKDVKK